ncbi:hypothetical protein BT96DRAFT_967386 [Gymnopus androsaceus JB14]|uniref:F-box domain-containing protein n=1 Tax=Gymnopus androsaceus JB14 TaxID=1447944 RepID=A0A6A4H4D0_9AGAR|nr:hypothetical protein BT96DRAFT_967386 [Gymnopus androsaceus JB14]
MQGSIAFRIQDLPVELGRSILEIAAREELKTALNLSLVCRQLKEWIQPLVYEMVTLGSGDIVLFLRTMEIFPPDFFARYTCTGVSSLACWVDFLGSSPPVPFPQLFHQLPLRRFSIEVTHFRGIILLDCTWIDSLTCLDLVFWDEDSILLSELQYLPALTHLALFLQHTDVEDSSLAYILSVTPALQVLCIVIDEDDLERFEHATRVDPRIVCVPHPESVPDWEAPYRGLPDIWSHAEEVVEERRIAATQVMKHFY